MEGHNGEQARKDFLIAMYNQMMNDINRHIVVVWQSIGVLFAALAAFALAEKGVVKIDFAFTLVVIVCGWMIAHVYDAALWYNRNLAIITNIERQFLRHSDLREIHYYFANHRRPGTIINHLEIQLWLAVVIWALVLVAHGVEVIIPAIPINSSPKSSWTAALPWAASVGVIFVWLWSIRKAKERYESFLENSPGIEIDDTGIHRGPGHPV